MGPYFIFHISVACILNEIMSTSKDLIAHFGRNIDELNGHLSEPPVIRLAATIDGGALTCHKGFIIYGIKFVQKEFVNLILGRPIFDGDDETCVPRRVLFSQTFGSRTR